MSTCVLVRPGETDYQQQGRIVGSLDLPLNAQGEAEIVGIIESVRACSPKTVYCGNQEPALTTAKAIAHELDLPLRELDDLTNVDQGLWQGLLIEEIREKQPKLYKKWQDCPEDVTPPNGECCEEAAKRVESALKKPLKKRETFVVVAAEPLATLVASVVRGVEPQLSGPKSRHDQPLVERIERGSASSNVPGDQQGRPAAQSAKSS